MAIKTIAMRTITTIFLFFCSFAANGQWFWQENFESPYDSYRDHFLIDTVDYPHNIWQIGRPHKTVFDTSSAFSLPNVIVTDTLHPYALNDTSVFIISSYLTGAPMFFLNFFYRLDIDSATIARVEISGDNGLNWINPITQDTTYDFFWFSTKPRLDTSTTTWKNFQLDISTWIFASPTTGYHFPHYRTSDTLLFRFTFISDSDTIRHDGWMMDNFYMENAIMEGSVRQVLDTSLISVYPVPSNGNLLYKNNMGVSVKSEIIIYNLSGQEVFRTSALNSSGTLQTGLPDGTYLLRYQAGSSTVTKRIVVQH